MPKKKKVAAKAKSNQKPTKKIQKSTVKSKPTKSVKKTTKSASNILPEVIKFCNSQVS